MFEILAACFGIALIIWVRHRTRLDELRLGTPQVYAQQPIDTRQDSAIVDELKALKQQMLEMQSTSHQFDLSFDEALGRLERRVEHLEERHRPINGAQTPTEPVSNDQPATLRAGISQ